MAAVAATEGINVETKLRTWQEASGQILQASKTNDYKTACNILFEYILTIYLFEKGMLEGIDCRSIFLGIESYELSKKNTQLRVYGVWNREEIQSFFFNNRLQSEYELELANLLLDHFEANASKIINDFCLRQLNMVFEDGKGMRVGLQ